MKLLYVEKFESWLIKNSKHYNKNLNNLNEYLNELTLDAISNGINYYELKSHETKSGNPECYYFYLEKDENEYSDIDYTIVF